MPAYVLRIHSFSSREATLVIHAAPGQQRKYLCSASLGKPVGMHCLHSSICERRQTSGRENISPGQARRASIPRSPQGADTAERTALSMRSDTYARFSFSDFIIPHFGSVCKFRATRALESTRKTGKALRAGSRSSILPSLQEPWHLCSSHARNV